MKSYLLLMAVLVLTACSTTEKQSTPDSTVVDSIPLVKTIDSTSSSVNSLVLKTSAAGDFFIGQKVSTFKKDYTLVLKSDTNQTEEGPEIVPVYYVLEGAKTLLKLKVDANETVTEISVYSPNYKTDQFANVGQSLLNFRKTYPDAKAYYTYVSGMYWLQTEEIPGMQFKLDGANYTGKEKIDDLDMKELDLDKFKPGTSIQEIRIWN